jgi:hypothetical protein
VTHKNPEWIDRLFRQAARFWKYVNKNGPVSPSCPERGPCWVWMRGKCKDGYGKFAVTLVRGEGPLQKHLRAHRASFILANGRDTPPGLVIMHHCDTPACVNPSHLSEATQAQNRADCERKGRGLIGTKNPNATITPEVVRKIRALHQEGRTLPEIMRSLGISRTAAWGVVSNLCWRHVA